MTLHHQLVWDALSNRSFISAVAAMGIAQMVKVVFYYFKERQWNIVHFFETGGLPSGHSAMVTALTLSIALTYRLSSPLFSLSFVMAMIIMYDAAGVRRATGKQALILNKIVEDIYATGKISEEKLHELVGHTPLEVVVGAIVGLITTLALHFLWRA